MTITSLQDLFLHTLKDIYFAENHITKALPMMAEKTSNPELQQLFQTHLAETRQQITRLEDVFTSIDEEADGEKCPAIEGITKEAQQLMKHIDDASTLDAALLASAQAVEHYEITRYGTMVAWAQTLGLTEAVRLLSETLDEEKSADAKLTRLAESLLNEQAV